MHITTLNPPNVNNDTIGIIISILEMIKWKLREVK